MTRSLQLFERAARVVPGGIYGHTSPIAALPGASPYFATRAEGCRYYDVDGNSYLDFMCGYGPIILGYHHPAVEEAATVQRARGSVFNHPVEVMVELAEQLTNQIDFADWAVFAKNGSDVTTWAVQVARQATGRRKILKVSGAYHGVDAWCTPGWGGVIEEDRTHVHSFAWNDLEAFQNLLSEHHEDVAAVVVTPYHHPSFAASVLPAPGFHQTIAQTCRKKGIVFILDDIRVGFRLHPGGSHRLFDFQPDIACYCKALGNGYPISAAAGRSSLKNAASKVFLTGSYWNNGEAQAAALTCLRILNQEDVPKRLELLGSRLSERLTRSASDHGFTFHLTGPLAAPYPVFDNDPNLHLIQEFCRLAIARGVFFHPHHNWFLSAAHNEEVIDEACAIAEECFDLLHKSHSAK